MGLVAGKHRTQRLEQARIPAAEPGSRFVKDSQCLVGSTVEVVRMAVGMPLLARNF